MEDQDVTFQAGQKVLYTGPTTTSLTHRAVYTVTECYFNNMEDEYVRLEGHPNKAWFAFRFETV